MPDTIETAQHFIFVTQVYFCSMYAVVLWDWVVCLPREWQFIWRTSWTPVKASYIFCRYWVIAVVPYLLYCFVIDHSEETCKKIYKVPVALAMWNQVGAESVLLIRTYAFFNRNKLVLFFLLCALSGMIAYQLFVATSEMLVLPFVKPPFDQGPCLPMSKPRSAHLLGFFIAPLAFDTVITLMTVYKAFYIRRHNGGPSSRLIQTFLREGVFYYFLISIANLINGIFYLQPRQVISAINIPLSVMLSPVLACRLILDLRQRGSETVSHSEGTIPAFTFNSKIFGIRFGGPRSDSNSNSRPAPIRSHIRSKTSVLNSGLVLSTLGSVTGGEASSPGSVELHSLDVRKAMTDEGTGGLGRHHDDDDEVPEYRSVDMMNLGMGLSGAVHGVRIDVEKQTSAM